MVAIRATCTLIALALFVQVFLIGSTLVNGSPPEPNLATSSTTAKTVTTTISPETTTAISTSTGTPTTTVAPPPTTIPSTTTPTSTTTPNTTTTIKPTPVPPAPKTTTPTPITTAIPTAPTPCPSPDRHFDGLSFMGGIILTTGLVAIGFILWKFYKARTERNYHTL